MMVIDEHLPEVRFLSGPESFNILAAAVEAAGGELHHSRPSQVQYRPGHDLVVRFRCEVTWSDGQRRRDTLIAGVFAHGVLDGTIPIVAEGPEGPLEVSVWRWPFDPILVGLGTATVPRSLAPLIGDHLHTITNLEVVAYYATERAVIRVDGLHPDPITGALEPKRIYLKVLPPTHATRVAELHQQATAAGLPTPALIGFASELGLLILAELEGPTLREGVKFNRGAWPRPTEIVELAERVAQLDPRGLGVLSGRMLDALGHAAMLHRILDPVAQRETIARLERLRNRISALVHDDEHEAQRARRLRPIHGDLHEAQIIIDSAGRITGLLDIDDVGLGDPVEDLAVTIGHLMFRHATQLPSQKNRTAQYVAGIRTASIDQLSSLGVSPEQLDAAIAGVLIGLATGPYRVQNPDWLAQTEHILEVAEMVLNGGFFEDENDLRLPSQSSHL